MINIALSFICSFAITYFAIPSVIKVATIRRIFDEPDERKLHKATIPALGGVAMFSGMFFSIIFWSESFMFEQLRWVVLSLVIIFLLGLKDDIVSIDPFKKLLGEIIAASIVIYWGEIRIESLHGFLSVEELSYSSSFLLSLFTIIVILNSYNLIDGIDGLAGSVGVIASLSFGILFLISNHLYNALIAFSLAGVLLAFLRYNFSPAKIFMGDGGSLTVGFLLALLCIEFIDTTITLSFQEGLSLPTPALAVAILIVPLTDTLRVFIIRLSKGQSPFKADRNHIHHMLLNLDFTHRNTTYLLGSINLCVILFTILFGFLGLHLLLLMIVISAFVLLKLVQVSSTHLSNKRTMESKYELWPSENSGEDNKKIFAK